MAGPLLLTVTGVPGFMYGVQTSKNLADWISVFTNASPFTFVDREANTFSRIKTEFRPLGAVSPPEWRCQKRSNALPCVHATRRTHNLFRDPGIGVIAARS
jgi:hypothetical protein